MKRSARLAGALTCALIGYLPAQTASAASSYYNDVYIGNVTGVDTLGFFGIVGQSLNTTYTANFLVALLAGKTTSGSGDRYLSGGTSTGTSDPVTATLTINGRSYVVGRSGYAGSEEVYNVPGNASVSSYASDQVGNQSTTLTQLVYTFSQNARFPTELGQRFSLTVDGQQIQGTGSFQVQQGSNLVENLTLTPLVTSVPEPGVWALMLSGVAMLGAALRIRKARRDEGAVKDIATA